MAVSTKAILLLGTFPRKNVYTKTHVLDHSSFIQNGQRLESNPNIHQYQSKKICGIFIHWNCTQQWKRTMADACTNKDESQMPKSIYDWIPFHVQSFKISKTYWWQIEVRVLIQVWVSAGIALFFNPDGGYMGMQMCENSLSYVFGSGTFLYFAFFFLTILKQV